MMHYIFNESGSIPGIPGTFANCRVDIDDQGNLTETPLAQHPAFEAAGEIEEPAVMSIDSDVAEKHEAEAAPAAQETIVSEQAQLPPAPYSAGG